MESKCRETARPARSRRHLIMVELLRHAVIVTDPGRLAYLNAKIAKRKAKLVWNGARPQATL
jgi:hypothetical protein